MWRVWILAGGLSCMMLLPQAATADDDLALRLASLSGLQAQFGRFPAGLTSSLDSSRRQLGEEKYQVLSRSVAAALGDDLLMRDACEYLHAHATDAELAGAVSFYEDPQVKRITGLTARAFQADYAEKLSAYIKSGSMPPADRVQLALRLMESMQYVELRMSLLHVIMYSMIDGVNRTMPKAGA
jgi:hypothetical protein